MPYHPRGKNPNIKISLEGFARVETHSPQLAVTTVEKSIKEQGNIISKDLLNKADSRTQSQK